MGRRSSVRADWPKLCSALALSLMAATATIACPLCYEAARQMITEGVQLDAADRVVLAARNAAGAPLRVVAVIKGSDAVGAVIAEPVTESAETATPGGHPSLLIRDSAAPQWTSLGTIPVADADWLRQIAATRQIGGERPQRTGPLTTATANSLSYSGWRQRVALVLPYLENANPLAARLAWGELARAPYVVLDVARSRIEAATVESWLNDTKLSPRYATYVTLLGYIGGPEDATRLERRIDAALAAHDATNLGAMIGADLELRGPSRIEWIESAYFADRTRTLPEIEAALLALDVHGDANVTVPRDRVIQAYRFFISKHPPMAGFVAPQLTEWDYWDAAEEYAALLESNAISDPASEFAISIYLQRAADAKAAQR